jgi:hypothetical protein
VQPSSDSTWPSFAIDRDRVRDFLGWPVLPGSVGTWPPHRLPSSIRDEKSVLLWLSTAFGSDAAMRDWLDANAKSPLHDEHEAFVEWLLPASGAVADLDEAVEISPLHVLLPFAFDCLERALLWQDPSPGWPGWPSWVETARHFYRAWLEHSDTTSLDHLQEHVDNELNSASELHDSSPSAAQTFCGVLGICRRLGAEYPEDQALTELVERCVQQLQASMQEAWSAISLGPRPADRSSWAEAELLETPEMEKLLLHLAAHEAAWCRNHLARLTAVLDAPHGHPGSPSDAEIRRTIAPKIRT